MMNNETLESLLTDSGVSGARKLEVASVLAESMVRELRVALAGWEATASELATIRSRRLDELRRDEMQ